MTVIDKNLKLVSATSSAAVTSAAGSKALTIRFHDLNRVLYVVSYKITTSPQTNATVVSEKLGTLPADSNVAGITVYVGAGTTVTVTGYAYGV